MITAKIIEDSISLAGVRLTTLQLCYPRFIHSEFMTHRVFSRSASSSRAIPVKKMIDMVRAEPAMPIHWGKNQPGMQANEQLTGLDLEQAKTMWLLAAENAASVAETMNLLGLHKQVANRILEPFQHIHVVMTATEFDNFFELRAHADAQPEIQALAREMQRQMEASTPAEVSDGQWHLPYVTEGEREHLDLDLLRQISAARCCRVSYLKHDGGAPSIEDDLALCERLIGARPLHASPFEHQATPHFDPNAWSGNFRGWVQNRKKIEASYWN